MVNTGVKLPGPVEVDETYIGGLEGNKHEHKRLQAGRGTVGKKAVVGIKDRATKQVRAEVVEDYYQRDLTRLYRPTCRP